MSESDAPAADWYPDPSGRFQFRYWDGETWTGHVSTDGKTDWDPPGDAPADAEAEVAPAAAAVTEEPAAAAAVDGDAAWAPQESAAPAAAAPVAAEAPTEAVAEPVAAVVAEPAAEVAATPVQTEAQAVGGAIAEDEPSDANLVANRRAGVAADVEGWLDEVAAQVEPRLSRINPGWTTNPQAEAARACAYGLLVGHLAHVHPHMRPELGQVAEAHPAFTTLEAGARLATLEDLAGDPSRTAAWLGPLIGADDPGRVAMLFD